jgi:hypothetical protein
MCRRVRAWQPARAVSDACTRTHTLYDTVYTAHSTQHTAPYVQERAYAAQCDVGVVAVDAAVHVTCMHTYTHACTPYTPDLHTLHSLVRSQHQCASVYDQRRLCAVCGRDDARLEGGEMIDGRHINTYHNTAHVHASTPHTHTHTRARAPPVSSRMKLSHTWPWRSARALCER